MHGPRRCCGELAELTVDDTWQIAGAADQQLQRLAHSSRRDTLELNNDGLSEGWSAAAAVSLYCHLYYIMVCPREAQTLHTI